MLQSQRDERGVIRPLRTARLPVLETRQEHLLVPSEFTIALALIELDLDVFAHTSDDEDEDEDDKPEESESEGVLRYCCSCSLS